MKYTFKYLIILLLFSCSKEIKDVSLPSILSFTLQEFQGRVVEIKDNQITVSLPYGTLVKSLSTKIETQNTVEIIPRSGIPQDFSKPIYYTLIGENGTKVIYTVKVILESQPTPIISSIENDTTEAGLKNIIVGKNFGNFDFGVKASLINSKNEPQEVPFKLLDSTKIEIVVPILTKVGNYKVNIKVNTLEVVSATTLYVGYPSPQIESLSHKNILSNDTLWITGKYFDPSYAFSAVFKKTNTAFEKPAVLSKNNQLGIVPKDLVGQYDVLVRNISERKLSKLAAVSVNVFDHSKPFIVKILSPKELYRKGDRLIFETKNFDKAPARFYQAILKNNQRTYIQNGLFSNGNLSVILPENIIKGKYSVSFLLSDPEKNYNYSFENDMVVDVE